ncbi:MAG: tetratricopeptide repeat protein [Promethearchaeota archaeon]
MDILEIKKLIDQGKYTQALKSIDELQGKKRLDGIILKSQILQRKGDPKEALAEAKSILAECRDSGSELQVLKALISLGSAYFNLQNIPELTKVLQEAEHLFSQVEFVKNDVFQECQGTLAFLQGAISETKGNINHALELFEKSLIIRQALPFQHDVVETLTTIGFIHLDITGKQDLAFDLFNRSLAISEKLGNPTAIAHSLNRLGCYYHQIENYDEALSYFERSLALYQSVNNKEWIGGLYNNISLVYRAKENYDLTMNYLERALAISEELDDKRALIINHNNIGWLHAYKGNLSFAEQHFTQSLLLAEETGDRISQAFISIFIGDIHSIWKGELSHGLDYYQRSLSIFQDSESDPGIAWTLLRIGMTNILRGEPESALKNIEESESIFTKLDLKGGIANSYVQLGRIYKIIGEYDQAIKYLEDGIKLVKETIIGANLGLWVSYILLQLILVAQNLNSLDLAKDYLKQMQELKQTSKNKYVKLRIQFSEAIVLKMSKRMAEKFQAQQKFQAIIEEEIFSHDITVLSMLNLCELLILEMKYSETADELLDKVIQLSTQLHTIANSQQSSSLTILSLLLQTKLALVQGDVEEASQLLSNAKKLASEKKLVNLLTQIKAEQETVQAELDKWNQLIQRKASIQERIEHAQIASWLVEAKKIQETWVNPTSEIANQ